MACYKIIIKNVILISLFYSIITVSSKKEDEDFENCMDQMEKHCDIYKHFGCIEPNSWHCMNRAVKLWLKDPKEEDKDAFVPEGILREYYLEFLTKVDDGQITAPIVYCETYVDTPIAETQCKLDLEGFGTTKYSALDHALYYTRAKHFDVDRSHLHPALHKHFGALYMDHLARYISPNENLLKLPKEYCKEKCYPEESASTSTSTHENPCSTDKVEPLDDTIDMDDEDIEEGIRKQTRERCLLNAEDKEVPTQTTEQNKSVSSSVVFEEPQPESSKRSRLL